MKYGVDHSGLRTWIEIDRSKIAKNFAVFRGLLKKDVKLMSVVKSNAYGHSLLDFSKEVVALGTDWLGVDSVVEAVKLRAVGIKIPILVLGYSLPEKIPDLLENDISFCVSTFEQMEEVVKRCGEGKTAKIHIKIDTGMHRQGFLESDWELLLEKVSALQSNVVVEGCFTHFSSAKNPSFPAYTNMQINSFERFSAKLKKVVSNKVIFHACATSGALLFPSAHFDMVRIGMGLYGYWPSVETRAALSDRLSLSPALCWKTSVSEIKQLPKGARVGYDGCEVLDRDTKIGICPVGYWHGYDRALSSIGRVVVMGAQARVLGRISMDMIVVDCTDIENVSIQNEVILLGGEISATDIAELLGTSHYEVTTVINPLIKRFYIN